MLGRTKASPEMTKLFEEYQYKVLDPNYFPKTPVETLRARATAVYLLNSDQPGVTDKAAAFIKATSTHPDNDLMRLTELANKVTYWESLNIVRSDEQSFCEYVLACHQAKTKISNHFHAKYHMQDDRCIFNEQDFLLQPRLANSTSSSMFGRPHFVIYDDILSNRTAAYFKARL